RLETEAVERPLRIGWLHQSVEDLGLIPVVILHFLVHAALDQLAHGDVLGEKLDDGFANGLPGGGFIADGQCCGHGLPPKVTGPNMLPVDRFSRSNNLAACNPCATNCSPPSIRPCASTSRGCSRRRSRFTAKSSPRIPEIPMRCTCSA